MITELTFNGHTIYYWADTKLFYAQWIDARLNMTGYLYRYQAADAQWHIEY